MSNDDVVLTRLPAELQFEGLGAYVQDVRALHGGTQVLFEFPNGWTGSVIQHDFSSGGTDGLFEVGVIDPSGDMPYLFDGDSVLGYLDAAGVARALLQIKAQS